MDGKPLLSDICLMSDWLLHFYSPELLTVGKYYYGGPDESVSHILYLYQHNAASSLLEETNPLWDVGHMLSTCCPHHLVVALKS